MPKNKSAFEEWFRKKFGPPPKVGIIEATKKVDSLRMELFEAKISLRDAEKYLDRRTAALCAWKIKDKDKKPSKE